MVGCRSPLGGAAIGGVLMVMLWKNVISKVLFFGAEVCKVVATSGPGAELAG